MDTDHASKLQAQEIAFRRFTKTLLFVNAARGRNLVGSVLGVVEFS